VGIFALVLVTIVRSPVIHTILARERFPTIGAARSYMITITFNMIAVAFMFVILAHNGLIAIGTTRHDMITIAFNMIAVALMLVVLTGERLPTVGTARGNRIEITLRVIGETIMRVETCIGDGLFTGSTDKMLWMPCSSQSGEVFSIDRLSAAFADGL